MSNIYLLPISCFILFQCTFIATYIASIVQYHVVPDVPYISDSATYSPESCIFGQLINTGCVLLACTIYARYRQIFHVTNHFVELRGLVLTLSEKALYFGFASCYGISIVANFQETNAKYMHYIGASLAFGMGTTYFGLDSFISYRIEPFITLKKTVYRIIIAILCCIFFIGAMVCGIFSHILFEGTDPRHWYPSDGGWQFHVASSISEWIVAILFNFYVLTFSDEFKFITFNHPEITFIEIDEEAETVVVVQNVEE